MSMLLLPRRTCKALDQGAERDHLALPHILIAERRVPHCRDETALDEIAVCRLPGLFAARDPSKHWQA